MRHVDAYRRQSGIGRLSAIVAHTPLTRGCCEIFPADRKSVGGLTIVTRHELLERMPEESPSHRCRIRSDLRLGQCRAHMVV
jgi:hypothetical protein